MATHFHQLTIADIRKETSDCISIAFHIPDALQEVYQFTQGQNITLKAMINGEELRRSYSICSSPADKELRIAIKEVKDGKFSTWANGALKKGDILEVLPPAGRFFTSLHPTHKKHYLAFVAGSGITPVISIIKTTLATEPDSRFTLIYGNRNRASIIFKEQLEAIKNRYMQRFILHHILSREKTDAAFNYGRINASKCSELSAIVDIAQANEIFICGPEEMIFSLKGWLEEAGVDKKKIHFELFSSPDTTTKKQETTGKEISGKQDAGKESKVTVKLDGIAFDFSLKYDGRSILDAALHEGADLPYACKGGVCATCRAKLLEGQVNMDINYALEPEEIEQGFILTCQSHPCTEKVVVDFDAR